MSFTDDPEKQSFCSCGGPASDVMIQCTLCLDWFHSPKCVPPPKILSTGPKKSESENSNGNDNDDDDDDMDDGNDGNDDGDENENFPMAGCCWRVSFANVVMRICNDDDDYSDDNNDDFHEENCLFLSVVVVVGFWHSLWLLFIRVVIGSLLLPIFLPGPWGWFDVLLKILKLEDVWLSVRPPSENINFILTSFIRQFLVTNWPWNMKNAVEIIWGHFRCHFLVVIGRSNFESPNLLILIADLDSLQKKYDSKVSFFLFSN